jgi:hypothetical protein
MQCGYRFYNGATAVGVAGQQPLLLRLLHYWFFCRLRPQPLLVRLRLTRCDIVFDFRAEPGVERSDPSPAHHLLPVSGGHHCVLQPYCLH